MEKAVTGRTTAIYFSLCGHSSIQSSSVSSRLELLGVLESALSVEESSFSYFFLDLVGYFFFFLWVILRSLLISSFSLFVKPCTTRSRAISTRHAMKRAIVFITASDECKWLTIYPNDSGDCKASVIAYLTNPVCESCKALETSTGTMDVTSERNL